MARPTLFLYFLAAVLYLSPTFAFYPNITTPSYVRSLDSSFGSTTLGKRADPVPNCAPYKKVEGSFCGPLCGCNDGLTCIQGKCSTAAAPALVHPGCTSDDQCPSGMGCGWVTGKKEDGSELSLSPCRDKKRQEIWLTISRLWYAICQMYETKRLFRSIRLRRRSIYLVDQG